MHPTRILYISLFSSLPFFTRKFSFYGMNLDHLDQVNNINKLTWTTPALCRPVVVLMGGIVMEAAFDYPDLFNLYGQREDEMPKPAPEKDLVRTGPGQGWPTFEKIMAQAPDGPAKEAARELRRI